MELAGEFNSPLQYRCMLDKILANLQSILSMIPELSRGGSHSIPDLRSGGQIRYYCLIEYRPVL